MKGNKKELVVGTRVDGRIQEELEEYCLRYDVKKSKVLRDALVYYLRYSHRDENSINPLIIFAKNNFEFMLTCMDDDQIKELSEMAYSNGKKIIKYNLSKIFKDENFELPLKNFLGGLDSLFFDHNGQNWLNEFKYGISDKNIWMEGAHQLGVNFSKFLRGLLLKHLIEYGFNISNKSKIDEYEFSFVFNAEK